LGTWWEPGQTGRSPKSSVYDPIYDPNDELIQIADLLNHGPSATGAQKGWAPTVSQDFSR